MAQVREVKAPRHSLWRNQPYMLLWGGQIVSAVGFLGEPWGSSDCDVREGMSGNICRCGAYPGIVAAIQQVRQAQQKKG